MSEQKKREPTRGGVMVVPTKNIKALSFNGVATPGQGKKPRGYREKIEARGVCPPGKKA